MTTYGSSAQVLGTKTNSTMSDIFQSCRQSVRGRKVARQSPRCITGYFELDVEMFCKASGSLPMPEKRNLTGCSIPSFARRGEFLCSADSPAGAQCFVINK